MLSAVLWKRSHLRFTGILGGNEELHLAVLSSGHSQRDVCLQVEMLLTPDVDLTCQQQPENRFTSCSNLGEIMHRSSQTFHYVLSLFKSRLQVSILQGSDWLIEGLGGNGLLSIKPVLHILEIFNSFPSTFTHSRTNSSGERPGGSPGW